MLAIGVPGPFELIVIALIVLLLFGKRLPGLMNSLGRSVVEFKKGVKESDNLDSDEDADSDRH